jgi:hypothetical protein
VASPDDWGALPAGPPPAASHPSPLPTPPAAPATFDLEPDPEASPAKPSARGGKEQDRTPARSEKLEKGEKPEKARGKGKPKEKEDETTPDQVLARGWASVRRGLFWIQFALFWLAIIGFVGFGKAVYTRTVGDLPSGEGWVKIEGYINTDHPNAIRLSKTDELNVLMYGVPVLLAGVCIVLGRMIASGAPKSSGARGLFTFSTLFGLLGFGSLIASFIFAKFLLKDAHHYTERAYMILLPLAEFWFLCALVASGVALTRPKAVRAVGMVGFMFALTAFVATLGWELYKEYGRPKTLDVEILTMEQAAFLLGWLLLIAVYSRAVRRVRLGAKAFIESVEDETEGKE